MANKTDGVKILVQEVLAAEFSEPYPQNVILRVFLKIQENREWKGRYYELSDDLHHGWVVNNWIGKYVKAETGLPSLGKGSADGKSEFIKSYTKLGHA